MLVGFAALKITSDRMVNYVERTGKRLTTEYFWNGKESNETQKCVLSLWNWSSVVGYGAQKMCRYNHVKTICCSFAFVFRTSESQRCAKFRAKSYSNYFAWLLWLLLNAHLFLFLNTSLKCCSLCATNEATH